MGTSENCFNFLPISVIEKILSYLQPLQKKNIMMLNSFLYKTVRELYDPSLWINLKSVDDLNLNYGSMMSSIRAIPNVRLGGSKTFFHIDKSFEHLELLFAEFGENFRVLEINNCMITMFHLKLLLNETPYLEKLVIHSSVCVGTSAWRKDAPPRLSLENLKDVSISYCDKEMQNIVLALTKAEITSFKLISNDLQVLMPTLMKHSEIKKLTIQSNSPASATLPSIIREMKLDEISLNLPPYQSVLRGIILVQYHNLKTVDLASSFIVDADFLALGACYHLEKLKIVIDLISPPVFGRIILFQELKELTLIKNDKKGNSQHLKIITATKIFNLNKLEIIYPSTCIDVVDFKKLNINAPNLKHLVVNSRITGTLAMNVVNKLLKLKSLSLIDSIPYSTRFIKDADLKMINSNMRELSLNFDAAAHAGVVLSIINKFPDLEKIEITTSEQGLNFNFLMSHIIGDLKNLRVLKIDNSRPVELTFQSLGFIHILYELGKKLQHVSFNVSKPNCSQNVYNIIGRQFSFINHKDGCIEFHK